MKVGVAKETAPGERRVALVPEALGRLTAAGLEILVESGAGGGALIPDQAYAEAGATIVSSVELYGQSDVILRVQKPSESEIKVMRAGQAGEPRVMKSAPQTRCLSQHRTTPNLKARAAKTRSQERRR